MLHPPKRGKVRHVLNGAAKFYGVSMNNALLTGFDLLQTLIHVLMRFRQHPYAVSADIEGMFLQVGVIPQDRPSLRFLGGRTQQQTSLCTSTYATFSVQRTHRLVPTMRFNEMHVITAKSFQKPRKVSKAIFTWTITLSRRSTQGISRPCENVIERRFHVNEVC